MKAERQQWQSRVAWFLAGLVCASAGFASLALRSNQAAPARHSSVLASALDRDAVCLIYAVFSDAKGQHRTHLFGTGFVAANGKIVTNRHIIDPTYEPQGAEQVRSSTARAARGQRLRRVEAYFPNSTRSLPLTVVRMSERDDLAVLGANGAAISANAFIVAEGAAAGEAVRMVGYPLGIDGLLAKAPPATFQKLKVIDDDARIVEELASSALVRPTVTSGHIADIVEDRLILDATSAPGGSGTPVVNSRGEVVGVVSGLMRGFAGASVGVSSAAVRELLRD